MAKFTGFDWTITASQIGAERAGLPDNIDVIDLAIFESMIRFSQWKGCKRVTINGHVYFSFSNSLVPQRLHRLGLKSKSAARGRIKKLKECGLLIQADVRNESLYRAGPKFGLYYNYEQPEKGAPENEGRHLAGDPPNNEEQCVTNDDKKEGEEVASNLQGSPPSRRGGSQNGGGGVAKMVAGGRHLAGDNDIHLLSNTNNDLTINKNITETKVSEVEGVEVKSKPPVKKAKAGKGTGPKKSEEPKEYSQGFKRRQVYMAFHKQLHGFDKQGQELESYVPYRWQGGKDYKFIENLCGCLKSSALAKDSSVLWTEEMELEALEHFLGLFVQHASDFKRKNFSGPGMLVSRYNDIIIEISKPTDNGTTYTATRSNTGTDEWGL